MISTLPVYQQKQVTLEARHPGFTVRMVRLASSSGSPREVRLKKSRA